MYNYSNIVDRANNLEQSAKNKQWSDKIIHQKKSLHGKKSEDSTDSKKIERKILLYHCCNTTTLTH